jgi:hypothetical protein
VSRKEIGVAFSMAYTVTSDIVGFARVPYRKQQATCTRRSEARQMYETGLVNVSIKDQAGHEIDGDELLACITGKKTITNDLQAK